MSKLAIENRIQLLTSRQKDNLNIVKKLQRKLRALEKKSK